MYFPKVLCISAVARWETENSPNLSLSQVALYEIISLLFFFLLLFSASHNITNNFDIQKVIWSFAELLLKIFSFRVIYLLRHWWQFPVTCQLAKQSVQTCIRLLTEMSLKTGMAKYSKCDCARIPTLIILPAFSLWYTLLFMHLHNFFFASFFQEIH